MLAWPFVKEGLIYVRDTDPVTKYVLAGSLLIFSVLLLLKREIQKRKVVERSYRWMKSAKKRILRPYVVLQQRVCDRKIGNFFRVVRDLLDLRLAAKYTKCASKVQKMDKKCKKSHQNGISAWFVTWGLKNSSSFWIPIFGSKFQFSQPGWCPGWAIKSFQMFIFFDWRCDEGVVEVWRWWWKQGFSLFLTLIVSHICKELNYFSLVAKCTKHVSKVREMVRRCEKIVKMTSSCESWRLTCNKWHRDFGF